MKASDSFFAGNRYALFGVKAAGRAHGLLLIAALKKAGKCAVAIQPDGAVIKGVDQAVSLSEAGDVDGAVILPPSPWSEQSAQFTEQALLQCKQQGITNVWIYPDGTVPQVAEIASRLGVDAVIGVCPCLHIASGGFPHNLHRWIESWRRK